MLRLIANTKQHSASKGENTRPKVNAPLRRERTTVIAPPKMEKAKKIVTRVVPHAHAEKKAKSEKKHGTVSMNIAKALRRQAIQQYTAVLAAGKRVTPRGVTQSTLKQQSGATPTVELVCAQLSRTCDTLALSKGIWSCDGDNNSCAQLTANPVFRLFAGDTLDAQIDITASVATPPSYVLTGAVRITNPINAVNAIEVIGALSAIEGADFLTALSTTFTTQILQPGDAPFFASFSAIIDPNANVCNPADPASYTLNFVAFDEGTQQNVEFQTLPIPFACNDVTSPCETTSYTLSDTPAGSAPIELDNNVLPSELPLTVSRYLQVVAGTTNEGFSICSGQEVVYEDTASLTANSAVNGGVIPAHCPTEATAAATVQCAQFNVQATFVSQGQYTDQWTIQKTGNAQPTQGESSSCGCNKKPNKQPCAACYARWNITLSSATVSIPSTTVAQIIISRTGDAPSYDKTLRVTAALDSDPATNIIDRTVTFVAGEESITINDPALQLNPGELLMVTLRSPQGVLTTSPEGCVFTEGSEEVILSTTPVVVGGECVAATATVLSDSVGFRGCGADQCHVPIALLPNCDSTNPCRDLLANGTFIRLSSSTGQLTPIQVNLCDEQGNDLRVILAGLVEEDSEIDLIDLIQLFAPDFQPCAAIRFDTISLQFFTAIPSAEGASTCEVINVARIDTIPSNPADCHLAATLKVRAVVKASDCNGVPPSCRRCRRGATCLLCTDKH